MEGKTLFDVSVTTLILYNYESFKHFYNNYFFLPLTGFYTVLLHAMLFGLCCVLCRSMQTSLTVSSGQKKEFHVLLAFFHILVKQFGKQACLPFPGCQAWWQVQINLSLVHWFWWSLSQENQGHLLESSLCVFCPSVQENSQAF